MYKKIILLCLFVLTSFVPVAEARVDIIPRKVVMEPRDRSAEITILNLFDKPGLYRITILNYRQNTDGSYTKLETPLSPEFDPNKHVRISPRQFTVTGGGRQKIRFSIRKPEGLPDGEYRFHVLATRYENNAPREDDSELNGASIKLTMNLGVAIPVVVKHGNLDVQAQIASANYISPRSNADRQPLMNVEIARSGGFSSIGKLDITSGGEQVGYIDNMNVFSEINRRTISVPLRRELGAQESIKITYSDDNGNIFDEKTIQP